MQMLPLALLSSFLCGRRARSPHSAPPSPERRDPSSPILPQRIAPSPETSLCERRTRSPHSASPSLERALLAPAAAAHLARPFPREKNPTCARSHDRRCTVPPNKNTQRIRRLTTVCLLAPLQALLRARPAAIVEFILVLCACLALSVGADACFIPRRRDDPAAKKRALITPSTYSTYIAYLPRK